MTELEGHFSVACVGSCAAECFPQFYRHVIKGQACVHRLADVRGQRLSRVPGCICTKPRAAAAGISVRVVAAGAHIGVCTLMFVYPVA